MKQMTLATVQDALQSAPIGILLLDDKKCIQWRNNTLSLLLDITDSDLTGTPADELRTILTDPPETLLLQQGDKQRWLRCNRQTIDAKNSVIFYMDITTEQQLRHERDQLADDLQQLTTRDPITGLPNRHALLQGLEPLVSRSRRYGNPLSLIKLHASLEGNDTPTEAEQQQTWMLVAQLLKDQMRWADIIGRYDGSDFLLILPETAEEAARQLAEKLCTLMSEQQLKTEEGKSYRIKPYCGITGWRKGDDATLMLQRISDSVSAAKTANTSIAA
jgi:diguanylate cyclase (GGDEF)-like protein